ncbi:MAG: type II toxin-antitoxin system PemK/MazF family toxin [Vicinamibacterales bacterium]
MKWGEIYRTRDKVAERRHKPGFYVVVSRDFIAGHEDVDTVVCAPVYSQMLGLRTEVAIGDEEGLSRECAVRCDFLTLMLKHKLTGFIGTLSSSKQAELKRALIHALQLDR